jgi:site-specific DNA recombinase
MSRILNCAIYTRKSNEEGLDQSFNSLHAQREACEAYIKSQRHEGWRLVPTAFDDAGYSGGTMQRPALVHLMKAVQARTVDIIVVYKVDRLSRSLADFAKMVEVFDENVTSFVSVTQQFNTTTSMGRLTLNVLRSFAQFEREVTAERIRDKIAASKKKGLWMGGNPPLGYDVYDRQLVINELEAKTVRRLFLLYQELGSVRRLQNETARLGIITKRRVFKKGRTVGGRPFSRGNLYALLSNPIYTGEIRHHSATYPGRHEPVADRDTWNGAQQQLTANTAKRRSLRNFSSSSLLTGLVYDETGDRLSPSYTFKNARRYRYYVSSRLTLTACKKSEGWRIPARELEGIILYQLGQLFSDPQELMKILRLDGSSTSVIERTVARAKELSESFDAEASQVPGEKLQSILERVTLHPDRITIKISRPEVCQALSVPYASRETDESISWDIPIRLKRRGVEMKLILLSGSLDSSMPDQNLIRLIAQAHSWFERLSSGAAKSVQEIADKDSVDAGDVSRTLPVAFFSAGHRRSHSGGTAA